MNIYHALKIGDHHINNCEDYLQCSEIGNEKLVCAVMDGCSMGTDSYFASTLTGKLLRKISRELAYKDFIFKNSGSSEQLLRTIMEKLFQDLGNHKNSLQLAKDEILSTLLIAIIDKNEKSGEFLCIGDGLICINNNFFEFEQNDMPDYLGYHLHKDFNDWYKNQKQRISFKGISDFSIATDGIFSFKKFDNKIYKQPSDLPTFLLADAEGRHAQNMLDRKLLHIQADWGLRPADDLAIVRGIFN